MAGRRGYSDSRLAYALWAVRVHAESEGRRSAADHHAAGDAARWHRPFATVGRDETSGRQAHAGGKTVGAAIAARKPATVSRGSLAAIAAPYGCLSVPCGGGPPARMHPQV